MSSSVEVEELPTQALLPHSRSRVPLTGAVAVAAMGILLAAGFGFLGGRAGPAAPSAVPSLLAVGPSQSAAALVTPAAVQPEVTPWAPCGDAPGDALEPYLQVNGEQHFGNIELNVLGPGPDTDVFGVEPGEDLELVDVPMDGVTEIWMPGGRCALEWYISMKAEDDPVPIVLESVANKALDPAIASQNRFELFVAPYVGDFELRATFALDDVAVRGTWRIRIPELLPPDASLRAGNRAIETVIGCNVVQRLPNGSETLLNPCFRDVEARPSGRTDVQPGEKLEFTIGGWIPGDSSVACGQLEDRRFTPQLVTPCNPDLSLYDGGIRFAAPEEPGPWTLAIGTCAKPVRFVSSSGAELCGAWYANILVRD